MDDCWFATGDGAALGRGTIRQLILSIQNDSEAPDAFRIIGVSTILTNSFTVTYRRLWQPALDITSQVNSLALTTHTLTPGEIFYFRVYIDVPVSNSADDLYGAVLQIASLADGTKTDAVRFSDSHLTPICRRALVGR